MGAVSRVRRGPTVRPRLLLPQLVAVALVAAVTVVASTAVEVSSPTLPAASAAPVAGGLGFTALATPCRAVDTRSGGGALGPDVTRSFQVGGPGSLAAQGGAAGGCGVPDGAGSVEVAVNAVNPVGAGYLRAFAAGSPVPNATVLNYTSATSITNTVTVPLAATGTLDLSIKNFVGTTHVVVDVLGYFTTSPTADLYQTITPCRAVDTRVAGGRLTTGAGEQRGFQISGSGSLAAQGGTSAPDGCLVPVEATAAVVSITAVDPVGNGYLRAGPNGFEPVATVVNYTSGTSITNTGAVRLGDLLSQDLSLKNFLGSTHVVVDVLGYYSSGSVRGAEGVGSRYQTVTPCRAVDTRFAPGGRIAAATTRLFQVAGERNAYAAQGTTAIGGCGVPDRAAAVTVAVTAVAPTGGGFARAYPAGGEPTGTFLNFSAARSMTNAGAVTLGVSGLRDLALSNYVAGSDFVVDVLGYYDANSFATVPTASSSISVGGSHSCRTAALGTVECWGNNGNGQLGSMRKGRNRSWPAPVLGLYGATSVDTGRDHTCALLTGGSVSCWGNNSAGELGDGGTDDRGTPANVLGLATAVSVATGGEHSCALLASRTVRCWGDNAYGQLGDGTLVQQNTPVTVLGLSNVAAIAAGEYYTCALLVDGSARCWGDNANGQLGDGTTTDRSAPTVVGGLTGATAISASNSDDVGVGGEFTCALVANGSVRCWGENSRGQLGDGTTTDRSVPTAVTSLSSATSISVGTSHACASLADGAVKCWGGNEAGTIGDATTTDRPTPTALAGIDTRTKVVEVSAGGRATCATFQTSLYLSPGSLSACWGSRTSGRLGTPGESGSSVSPTAVAASFGSSLIAVGANHTCSTGFLFSVLCWGQNDNGQLGDGTTTNRSSPTFVGTTAAIGLTAGQDHTCILRFDGSVLCWGDNLSGQLGIGTTDDQTEPSLVSTLPTAVAVSAGDAHTCALLADGSARCWGDNSGGQLGNGTTSGSSSPVVVTGLAGAVSISAGGQHTCATLLNGTTTCWGTGAALGNGSSVGTQLVPQTVSGLAGVFDLDAGVRHSCSLVATPLLFGALRCWGENLTGQIGDGSTTTRTTPVAASGLDNVNAVSSGLRHTCALVSNDSPMRCWGENGGGQLGIGSTTDQLAPTAVTGLADAVAVDTGDSHTCVIRGFGTINCWGSNLYGQLGDGTLVSKSVPTPVPALG